MQIWTAWVSKMLIFHWTCSNMMAQGIKNAYDPHKIRIRLPASLGDGPPGTYANMGGTILNMAVPA